MPYDREYELILKAKDSRTNVIKENVTIKDQKLIAWMSKFVIDAIDNCEAPVYLFGINENAILRKRSSGPPTIKQLKQAASTKSKKYSPDLNKQSIGQFCLELLPFLNNETSLKAKEGKKTSDRQLSFLYEVCKLFDLIDKDFDTDSLDVTPIKHMRTLLSDSRKAINKKR